VDAVYRSYVTGQHALAAADRRQELNLIDCLQAHQLDTWLVTDEPLVAEQPESQHFSERVILPAAAAQTAADAWEETRLASFFAALIDVLEQAEPPFLIWAHAQALRGSWDAPYALRRQFAQEDDPDPPRFVAVPDHGLSADYDPDVVLGVLHAKAGQVTVLDLCLGVLLDAVAAGPMSDSMALVATSSRGFPLGEHWWVGPSDRTLSSNLLQVPWIMHWPTRRSCGERVQQFAQPADLCATLLDWFQLPEAPRTIWGRSLLDATPAKKPLAPTDRAVAGDGDQRLIRVPNWSLRQMPGESPRLFAKPDDRWEVNEVSGRCPREVELLAEVLEEFEQLVSRGSREDLADLPAELP
jgi:arylsulfatase A-like enzyme